jgi:hypothetical protein
LVLLHLPRKPFQVEFLLTSILVSTLDALSVVEDSGLSVNIPCFVITPHAQNPRFVGREEILEDIRAALAPSDAKRQEQRAFVLTGLGGMGKTQIAVEFVFKYRDLFPVTLWAHADSQARLAESFCLFATQLGLGDNLTAAKAKQDVHQCLANLSEYLSPMLRRPSTHRYVAV